MMKKISLTCDDCGKRHEVDSSNAGRTGKCSRCGALMIVPSPPANTEEAGSYAGYGLIEAEVPVSRPKPRPVAEASTFHKASGDASGRPRRARRATESGDFDGDPAQLILKYLPIGLGLTALAMIVLSIAVPNGVATAGKLASGLGVLMFGAAYLVGLYGAYREDSLYALLYVAIPLYTAYYIVSRFDDLRRWIIIGAIGLGLSTVGGAMVLSSGTPELAKPTFDALK